MINTEHYSCSFCGNDWTLEQGFNVNTKQCPPCDKYDEQAPKIKAERDRILKYWEDEGRFVEANLKNR